MKGTTHMAIGLATSVVMISILENKTGGALGMVALTSTAPVIIGSFLPDVDIHQSKAGKVLSEAVIGLIGLGLIIAFAQFKLGINLFDKFSQYTNNTNIIIGLVIWLVFGILGQKSGHRNFAHSLLGLTISYVGASFIFGNLAIWFAVGFLAHIVLDLLNKKPEKLLFPLSKGFYLNLVGASGIINHALCVGGIIIYFAVLGKLFIS